MEKGRDLNLKNLERWQDCRHLDNRFRIIKTGLAELPVKSRAAVGQLHRHDCTSSAIEPFEDVVPAVIRNLIFGVGVEVGLATTVEVDVSGRTIRAGGQMLTVSFLIELMLCTDRDDRITSRVKWLIAPFTNISTTIVIG